MEIGTERLEENRIKLTIEVEEDKVERAFSQTIKKLSHSVSVPGFRPGKVPPAVLIKKVGTEAIAHQALEQIIPDAYMQAVREKSIEPIDLPKFDQAALPERGKAFSFSAVVEVKPEVKLNQYKGLLLEKEKREVMPEEEDIALESLREHKAILAPTDEPVSKGNVVELTYQGYLEGKKLADFKGEAEEEIGQGNLLPDFEKALIGMKIGEKKRFETTLSESFPIKHYREKKVEIELIVKECKQKTLPEVDDLFAQSVGAESVAALKQKIRQDLEHKLAQEELEKAFSLLNRKAAQQAEVIVPEIMVTRATEELIQKMDANLRYYGLTVEDYIEDGKLKSENEQKSVENQAREKVRIDLVLEEIAKKEELTVTPAEIEREVKLIAARIRREPTYVMEKLKENGRLGEIEKQLLRYKAMQLILDHSEVKMVEPQSQRGGES